MDNDFTYQVINKLPEKASDAIRMVVKDLEAIEKDDRYVVDMEVWHKPSLSGKCHVCMAGAYLARNTSAEPYQRTYPDYSQQLKVDSFDALRKYNFELFLDAWIKEDKEIKRLTAILEKVLDIHTYKNPVLSLGYFYEHNPDQFKQNILTIAATLENEGY